MTANARAKYRGLLEAAPDAMVVVNEAGEIILLNLRAEHQFGYDHGELVGQPVTRILPIGFAERVIADSHRTAAEAVAQQIGTGIELSALRKDGSTFPIEIMLSPLGGDQGVLITAAIRDISVRKAAERHLAQMESRYRGLLEAAPDAMVVVDQAGVIVLVNARAETQFGFHRDELLGQQVKTIIPDGFAERLIADGTRSAAEALAQQIGTGIELSARRKDGTTFPIEIMLSPLRDADGILVTAAIRDITVRRAAETHLAQMEARYRGLLEAAPDPMVIWDETERIVLVNSRTEQVFGFSRDELVGQPTAVLFPDRARKLYRDRRAAAPLDPAPRSAPCAFEFLARRRDGTVFSAESIVSTVTTADGILVMAAVRDLTDRTRVEQQRSDLSAIVQASDDAIIGETLDGVVTSWNPGAQWLFGYAADEIVGRSIWVLVPPGREDEESAVLEALALGTTRRYETVRRRKNGMLVDVAVTSSPVRDTAGQVIGISKVASDITDRKRAEAALVHAKNAAEASSRELEAFSYSIAHDLRAPLRGMSGFAQLIMDAYREKLDATAQDWLGHIVANAQRMAALIDAMLSLSHVTQAAIRRARVDLATLARDVVGELAAAEPERAVELVIDGELCADLDPDLARALVENLIRNAWKFTSRVAAARIEVGIVPGTSDTFYVRDNGAGFDMASAGRLFTAFQRLHGLDEFEGTGIGLATVQRIVQRHGGQIWAEAAVDHGASFYFSFAPHTEESP